MNEELQSKLMELFIVKDFMACNKYLPINPRRAALMEYQSDPIMQQRVNGIVGDILEVIEKHAGLHSEKN
jgi:hypothetical protein